MQVLHSTVGTCSLTMTSHTTNELVVKTKLNNNYKQERRKKGKEK